MNDDNFLFNISNLVIIPLYKFPLVSHAPIIFIDWTNHQVGLQVRVNTFMSSGQFRMFSAVVKQLITRHGFHGVGEAVSGDCRCQRGCGSLRRWTWIVHTVASWTVRDASERDCVALTGTQRIETCLKGWGIEFYFLTAEWPFGSQGGRDRDGFRSRPPCSPPLLPQG